MTENEAIETIWERHMDCEDYFSQFGNYPDGYNFEFDQAILMAAQALEEIQQYRAMNRKLRKCFGDCDGLLKAVVDGICYRISVKEPIKLRLLTNEDADMWDAYRAVGTVEECREAVEKQKAKAPVDGADFMICRDDDGNPVWTHDYVCPECGMGITGEYTCCPYCGTYISWDEVE